MCKMLDWLNRLMDFDLRKFPPEDFGMLVGWSPWQVRLLCSCKDAALRFGWRQVGLQKISFILKCGNCTVQVDGVLVICCVETQEYSAYFD